jgi:hypothetical protein
MSENNSRKRNQKNISEQENTEQEKAKATKKAKPTKSCTEKGLCELNKWTEPNINECCSLMLAQLFGSENNIDAELFAVLFKRLGYGPTSSAPSSFGIAGEASLALVRELTAEAFYKALDYLSTTNSEITVKDGIFTVRIKADGERKKDLTFKVSKEIFEAFKENRKLIVNKFVYEEDQNMIKILAFLNYLLKRITVNPSENIINKIIYYLGLISCAKPVLDIGALYAILEYTFNHNQGVGYSTVNIEARIKYITQNINSQNFIELLKNVYITEFSSYNSNEKLPRNAVLETADGAAASIAGRYFTVLSDTSAEIARHIPFMTVDKKFRYIHLISSYLNMNDPNNIQKIRENTAIQNIISKMRIINECKEILTNISEKRIVIDLYYSILIDMDSINFIQPESRCIELFPEINNITVIPILKIYFDLFSVAKFLYLSRGGVENMKTLLMSCNYDSQCHDNKDCKYYRLLCIYYFILFPDKNTLINSFKEISGIDLSQEQNLADKISNLQSKYIAFYNDKSGKKGITDADMFENIDEYTKLLLANFPDEQYKFIFYWLANKDWDDIEGMLQNWKHHLCDLVFSDGNDSYVHIVKPLLVDPKTGIITITDITTEMSTDLNSKVGASLIPWNSNISVDLTTSWSTTVLLNIPEATDNTSMLIFTPVTEVDAASCRLYSTATFETDPVEMGLINCPWMGVSPAQPKLVLGFKFMQSTEKNALSIKIVPQLQTDNPVLNSQIIFLNNIHPQSEEAKIIFNRFTTIANFLTKGNFEGIFKKIENKMEACDKIVIEQIWNNIINVPQTEEWNNFFRMINELSRATNSFTGTGKPTIISITDKIKEFGDNLKEFFAEPQNPPKNPTKINMELYNKYFQYLNVVINAFATNKNYKNLTDRVTELISSLKRGEPEKGEEDEEDEEDSRKAKRRKSATEFTYTNGDFAVGTATQNTNKTETRKRAKGKKGGAPIPCDVLLSDIVGPYGVYMYTTEKGTYNSKPINSLDDIYKLNEMYNKMYSISERPRPEYSVRPSQTNIISQDIPGTGKGLDTIPTEIQEKNFEIIKSQWPNATDESIRSLILSVPNIQNSCKEVQDIYTSRMTSFLRKKGMDEKLACYIALNKNRLKLIPVTDVTVQQSDQSSLQPTAKPISDEENLRLQNEQYAKSFVQRQEYFKKFNEESNKREAANIDAMKVYTQQTQPNIKRGGKFITRKRRFNKLTKKKRKQIKARKTHNKAKKHRYTRHK